MNHDSRRRDQREHDAYLDDIEETQFFDVDSGIYKPKSCQPTARCKEEKPGTSNRTPLFFNAIPDSFTLTIALFSFCTLFVTFIAVVWYASVAEQQRVEMHSATVKTGISADAARKAAGIAEQSMQLDQRAWLVPVTGTLTIDENHPLRIDVFMQNAGKTPAFNIRTIIDWSPARRRVLVASLT
jgi:hypothetical protein